MKKYFQDKRILMVYIVAILLISLGITYALSTSTISLGLTTGIVKIDESAYGNTEFDSSNLTLTPIIDSEVEDESNQNNVMKIEFTVGGASTNNNDNIIYDIAIKDLTANCVLLSPYVKWKLVKNGTDLTSGSLDYKFDTVDENGRFLLTTIQQDLPSYSSTKTGYDNYVFYLWLSDSCQSTDLSSCTSKDDQSALLEQSLSGKIEVELYTEGKQTLTRHPSTTLSDSMCTNRYQVQYLLNGGSLTSPEKKYVIKGQPYGTLETPTKTNTVTFNTLGGSTITNLSTSSNSTFSKEKTQPKLQFLADTENTRSVTYTFDGWYLDEDYINKVESDTIVEADGVVRLYAKWSGNGTITLPTTTKTNYRLDGWYSDAKFQNKVGNAGDSYKVTKNITLYSKWIANTYLVKFYNNKDYLSGTDQVIANLSGRLFYKKYADPCLVAYHYGGEYTGPLLVGTTANSVAYYTSYDASTTLTYSGSFTQDGVTYYYSNLGYWMSGDVTDTSGLADRTKYSGITLEEAAKKLLSDNITTVSESFNHGVSKELTSNTYTKTGFTFKGWSTSPVGDVIYSNGQSVKDLTNVENGIVNLYAVWQPNSYTVNFNENYQKENMNNWNFLYPERFSITYDSSTKMNTVAVAGASGWETVYLPIGTINGRKYTLTFDYEVPTAYTALSGYNGVLYQVLSSAPTNTDNTDNVIVNEYIPTSATTSKVTKTITFTGTGSDVYFAFNYGAAADGATTTLKLGNISLYSSESKTYGKTFGTLLSSAQPGYTFNGWYTATSGGTKIISDTIMNTTKNYSVYANWTLPEYSITYDLNGGNVSGNPTTYTPITPNITLNNPTKSNHTFLGWYGSNDLSTGLNGYTASNPYTASSRDHILGNDFSLETNATYRIFVTGKRTAGTLEMQGGLWYTELSSGNAYDSYGGTFTKIEDLSNGYARYYKDIVVPSGKTKGKFYIQFEQDFSGGTTSWSLYDMHVIKVGSPVVIPKGSSGNKTYTAIFAKATMTITFDGQGATSAGTTSTTATFGSTPSNITIPTRSYTVSYNANGGSVGTSSSTANYTFNGYYTSTGGGGTQYFNSSGVGTRNWDITSNTTLYAYWSSTSVTLPTPSRTGYTFQGWYTESSGGTNVGAAGAQYTPTSSTTLYAQWAVNSYYFDLNGQLDGTGSGSLGAFGTVDIYINGSLVANDVADFYQLVAYGSSYEITDIKETTGHMYTGVAEGSLKGKMGAGATGVRLKFVTTTYAISSPVTGRNSLAEAISVANAGATITVQDNASNQSATFNKNLTLNLGGYLLSNTHITNSSLNTLVINSNGDGTISNSSGRAITNNNGYLTINSTIISSTGGIGIFNTGQLTLNSSRITTEGYAAIQNGTDSNKTGLVRLSNTSLYTSGNAHTLRNFSTQTWPDTSTSGYQSYCTHKCTIHITGSADIRQDSSTKDWYTVMNEYGYVHFPGTFTGTIYNYKSYVLRCASRGTIEVNGGTISAATEKLYTNSGGTVKGTINIGGTARKITHN